MEIYLRGTHCNAPESSFWKRHKKICATQFCNWERERGKVCLCVCKIERGKTCVCYIERLCVCVCECVIEKRERKCVCVRESVCKRGVGLHYSYFRWTQANKSAKGLCQRSSSPFAFCNTLLHRICSFSKDLQHLTISVCHNCDANLTISWYCDISN